MIENGAGDDAFNQYCEAAVAYQNNIINDLSIDISDLTLDGESITGTYTIYDFQSDNNAQVIQRAMAEQSDI